MIATLTTYRQISRELSAVWSSSRANAWDSAVQNAADTIGENSLHQVLDQYEITVGEYDDARDCAMAILTICTMQSLLCSPDEWNLTKRDINWFARRGITG